MALTVTSSTNGTQFFAVGSSVARVSFFQGQLLTQRDLQAEQRFHLLLQRIVQREAFGTGTVAGLEVVKELDTATLELGVFITPGLAFDPDGRELLLEKAVSLDVADPPVPATSTSFTGVTNRTNLADAVADRFTGAFGENDLTDLVVALHGAGLMTDAELSNYLAAATNIGAIQALLEQIPPQTAELPPPLLLREWLYNELVGQTYIGVQYRETGTHPSPALLDAACCGTTPCFPTRTEEAMFVVTSGSPFPAIEDPYQTLKVCLESAFFEQLGQPDTPPAQVDVKGALCSCLLAAWRGNPPLGGSGCVDLAAPVVPIAHVFWSRFALEEPSQILNVDNCSLRPLAPGGPAIRALVESLTGGAAPATLAPRVVSIEPANAAVVTQSDTLSDFTIRAMTNSALVTGTLAPADAYEIIYYAELNVVPEVFTGTDGPAGSVVTATYVEATPSAAMGIELTFTDVDTSGFPIGTYVFRLINGGTAALPVSGTEILSDVNNAQLDGEPNPPAAVPSGNGLSGGPFEARFVVTSG
jgi:hypothetical protein